MATNISRDFTRRTDLGSYGLQKSRDAERERGRERGREGGNQCNYSKTNDFSYKCRSREVPSLNCTGSSSTRKRKKKSLIIKSANSYWQSGTVAQWAPLTHPSLWVCCTAASSSPCLAGSVAPRPPPHEPWWRSTQTPGNQKEEVK